MSYLIAIDQSTSATKALLVGVDGAVVDSESRQHEQHYPRAGWVEHDAEAIWRNTLDVAKSLAARNTDRLAEVAGVSLTNQRETFVVFDRSTGEPLAPAIVWQCRRGDAICQELRDSGADPMVREKTGLRIDSYFSGAKITWVMREHPEIASRVRDGSACVATIDAYLIHRLTNGACYATDQTNASRTLLMDVRRRTWDDDLTQLFGVPIAALPEIRDSTARFGETNLGGALPSEVPICGILGDSQASLFAQRCYDTGDAKATFGSGTSVLLNVGPTFRPPEEGAVGALAWVIDGQPTYAWEGLINYSAATIAWLKDQLGLIDSVDEVEPLAASVEDADGVFLVPAFSGLGAPLWQPQARAAIVGMTGRTSKAHVMRAALDSIALQVGDIVRMLSDGGVSPKTLYADGGPISNSLLMQLVADAARCDILATAEPNLSPLGAAMAGMLGLGLVGSLDELRDLPFETRRYTPQSSDADAAKLHVAWREAVERVL